MLKLVCAENFKLFGPSDSELNHFQDLAFPIHSNGICCCSEIFSLKPQIPVQSKEISKYSKQSNGPNNKIFSTKLI